MITIPADEIQPGDVVAYGGHWHLVTRVERGDGWAWPVACDDGGWAMALGHDLIALHPPSDDLNVVGLSHAAAGAGGESLGGGCAQLWDGAEGDGAQRDRALTVRSGGRVWVRTTV